MFWKYAANLQENTHVEVQLYWNHASAWVFSCKFATYFQNTFFLRTPLDGCFCLIFAQCFQAISSIYAKVVLYLISSQISDAYYQNNVPCYLETLIFNRLFWTWSWKGALSRWYRTLPLLSRMWASSSLKLLLPNFIAFQEHKDCLFCKFDLEKDIIFLP